MSKLERKSSFILITSPQGEVLMLKRRNAVEIYRKVYVAGVYTLPGGGIEEGEDPLDAVIRENFEEIGVQLRRDEIKPLGVFKKTGTTTYFFTYEASQDQFQQIVTDTNDVLKDIELKKSSKVNHSLEIWEHSAAKPMKVWEVYSLGKEKDTFFRLSAEGPSESISIQRMLVLMADVITVALLNKYGDIIMRDLETQEGYYEVIDGLARELSGSNKDFAHVWANEIKEFAKKPDTFPGVDGDLDISSHNTQTEFRYR